MSDGERTAVRLELTRREAGLVLGALRAERKHTEKTRRNLVARFGEKTDTSNKDERLTMLRDLASDIKSQLRFDEREQRRKGGGSA